MPNLALPTRYFDTLKQIGDSPGTKAILLRPAGMSDISGQRRNAIMIGQRGGGEEVAEHMPVSSGLMPEPDIPGGLARSYLRQEQTSNE